MCTKMKKGQILRKIGTQNCWKAVSNMLSRVYRSSENNNQLHHWIKFQLNIYSRLKKKMYIVEKQFNGCTSSLLGLRSSLVKLKGWNHNSYTYKVENILLQWYWYVKKKGKRSWAKHSLFVFVRNCLIAGDFLVQSTGTVKKRKKKTVGQ